MKLIKPSFFIKEQEKGLIGIYKQIEYAGRICYKSHDKITEDSAEAFVQKMVDSKHCYTGDSSVLTEKGWIKWSEYKGEKVASVFNSGEFAGYVTPTRIVSYLYSGNFYNYETLGIEVTEGHKMFGVFRESKNNFYNNKNYNLFTCNTKFKDNNGRQKTLGERTFKVPKYCNRPFSTNPFGELIGFWLGDGCINLSTINKLTFHLKKGRKISYLKKLCEELGYKFEKQASNYYKVIHDGIGKVFNNTFVKNRTKFISSTYSQNNPEMVHSIMVGLINSDGSKSKNTKTVVFTSTSKYLIDWINNNAVTAGYAPSCKSKLPEKSGRHKQLYKIQLLDSKYSIVNDSRVPDSKVIITNKTEQVFCVTVPTGLILVKGRNGVTSICGNCSMLEHGTVYLKIEQCSPIKDMDYFKKMGSIRRYKNNKYSKVIDYIKDHCGHIYCITTNFRVIIENGWDDDMKYLCEPTEYHEKRHAVNFIADAGVMREFFRHRVFSLAQESTRYCDYSKGRFNSELTFIIPPWCNIEDNINMETSRIPEHIFEPNSFENKFFLNCMYAEESYKELINLGYKPQQARFVLPLSIKAEGIMTGFASDWGHFFNLRAIGTTGAPHPQAKELAEPLMQEFINRNYISSDSIKELE